MSTQNNRIAKIFFQRTPCLATHVHALKIDAEEYLNELQFLCGSAAIMVVSSGVKARILAALHISAQHTVITEFLKHCEATDVAKALSLLDRPRKSRQLSRKIQGIENQNPRLIHSCLPKKRACDSDDSMDQDGDDEEICKKRKRRRKIDLYRRQHRSIETELQEGDHQENDACGQAHLDTAVKEMIQSASVSGALARKVRQWARTNLKSDFLEFVLLTLPLDSWRNLADLVHFSPKDFSVPYFLSEVYGTMNGDNSHDQNGTSMEKSFVARMRKLVQTANEVQGLDKLFLCIAEDFPQTYFMYSYIRTQPSLMSNQEVVEQLARNIPLETAIWYFEELFKASRTCESIVSERLKGNEQIENSVKSKATYGKLIERILTFRRMGLRITEDIAPLATTRLKELKEFWTKGVDAKVAVFGDASSSMQCAVEAATVFASMVSVCFDGELSFFASKLVPSPHRKPSSVEETLEVCSKIRANGCTSMAAALWPYYEKKISKDMFVLVTDEMENTKCEGYYFADLLAKYKSTVNEHVSLVLVCVGKGDSSFRKNLSANNIEYQTVYIDESRPDLAKFDGLLGQLAMISSKCLTANHKTSKSLATAIEDGKDDFVVV